MIGLLAVLCPSASAMEHGRGVVLEVSGPTPPEVLEALDAIARERTGIRFTVVSGGEASACPVERRFACWATIAAHEAPDAAVLVVLSARRVEDRDRLSFFAFDLHVTAAVARDESLDHDSIENQIYAKAIEAPAAEVDSALALRVFFEAGIAALGPILGEHSAPLGRIDVRAPEGTEVTLDGRALGTADRVEDVRPGLRAIGLSPPGAPPVTLAVDVRAGETSVAAIGAVPATDAPPILEVALLGAGGAAIAGAAITVAVAVARAERVRSTCLSRAEGDDCPGTGGVTSSFDAPGGPTTDVASVNRRGASLPALGAALAITGAAWITGALVFFDDEELRLWLTFGSGLALGAIAYGVGAALSTATPE
jgi:hypothetical protein